MYLLNIYSSKFHFSLNFYSLFLLLTFIPDIVGIPPGVITYGLWLIKAFMGLLLIILYKKKLYHLKTNEKLFLFIVFVYFINILIDIFFRKDIINVGKPIDLIGFLISILIALSFRYNNDFSSNRSYFFFLFSLCSGLIIAFFLAREAPLPLINRFDANSTVNTINYGQMGCAMSIVAFYGLINKPFKYSRVIYPLLFLLGIISIMKAGSRSPVVVLLAVIVFYYFAVSGLLKGIVLIGFSAILLFFSIDLLIELSEAVGSGIVERLLSAIETGETSGRDAIYANAIDLFQKSPVFGDFYLISTGIGKGGYPHNFFIEAFMTTGLIGGIPFVIMIIICSVKSFKFLKMRHESSWVILLFMQILVYGMFSSSLFSSQDFWALSFFILSMPSKFQKRTLVNETYPRNN